VSQSDPGEPRPPTFSQQYGYDDYLTAIQHQDLDERSRTDLWNYIFATYLQKSTRPIPAEKIWGDFLARPVNYLDYSELFTAVERTVRSREWNRVYDLIQYLVQTTPRGWSASDDFNRIFAQNRVGWRIVEKHIVPITNESELQAITEAVATATTPTSNHIKNALSLLANRESPNYAKSIHESISAAEGAAQELAGIKKPLGEALETAKKRGTLDDLHPSPDRGMEEPVRVHK
jgi:hypothetical protein